MGSGAEVGTVSSRRDPDPALECAPNCEVDAEDRRDRAKGVLAVDEHRGAPSVGKDRGFGASIDEALTNLVAVRRQPHDPVRGDAADIGLNQRLRHDRGGSRRHAA